MAVGPSIFLRWSSSSCALMRACSSFNAGESTAPALVVVSGPLPPRSALTWVRIRACSSLPRSSSACRSGRFAAANYGIQQFIRSPIGYKCLTYAHLRTSASRLVNSASSRFSSSSLARLFSCFSFLLAAAAFEASSACLYCLRASSDCTAACFAASSALRLSSSA